MRKLKLLSSWFTNFPSERPNRPKDDRGPWDLITKGQQAVELTNKGRLKEAQAIYRGLIKKGHANHTVFGNLATICGIQGRHEELRSLLYKAIKLNPNFPEAHYNLGNSLKEQGKLNAAIASYKKSIELNPNLSDTHFNLGNTFRGVGDLNGAIASYKTAIKLKPDLPDAHYNLGNLLKEQGDLNGAIASYKTAIKLKPDFSDALFNLSLIMLLKGDYLNGWKKYEARAKRKGLRRKSHALPNCKEWNGEILKKNTELLLVTEQGYGDTLQFIRFALFLKKQGINVSICAQPKLHSLIKASGIDAAPLSPEQASRTTTGLWTPLLSVPMHLNVSPDNPITTEPYLKTTDELNDKWKSILSEEKRPIIGINCQVNPLAEKTELKGRSLPLEAFAPIANNHRITLLSLQKGFGSEQLEKCSFQDRFVGCQGQINDTWHFLETAAIISNCDLIVTSDTYVAHLAGGMGKPTWLLLTKIPDWRWGLEGETTFWYPSVRLFRQNKNKNWDEVLQRMAGELQQRLGSNPRQTQPSESF